MVTECKMHSLNQAKHIRNRIRYLKSVPTQWFSDLQNEENHDFITGNGKIPDLNVTLFQINQKNVFSDRNH